MPIPAAPAPDEHDPRLGERPAARAQRREEPADDDRGRALDVVVEARQPVAVAVEDAQRVVLLEVLPLDEAAGQDLAATAVDERLDELVVGRAAQPRRAVAEVQRIVEQRAGCRCPTSSETGSVSAGWMPQAAVYSASLPIGMAMPPAPWSPRPRIRSLSVTTMSRTSSYGPLAQDRRRCGRCRRA